MPEPIAIRTDIISVKLVETNNVSNIPVRKPKLFRFSIYLNYLGF